jgi:predicted anti-sigma-YlaC factor YlaD
MTDLRARRERALAERDELVRQAYARRSRTGHAPEDSYMRKRGATTVPVQTVLTASRTKRGSLVTVPVQSPALATTVLPESGEVRFIDAAINAGVAGASVLWTASRPTLSSQLGWAAFWMLLGGLMAVEGSAELRYAGFGLSASNASFLGLRLFHPTLTGT